MTPTSPYVRPVRARILAARAIFLLEITPEPSSDATEVAVSEASVEETRSKRRLIRAGLLPRVSALKFSRAERSWSTRRRAREDLVTFVGLPSLAAIKIVSSS